MLQRDMHDIIMTSFGTTCTNFFEGGSVFSGQCLLEPFLVVKELRQYIHVPALCIGKI